VVLGEAPPFARGRGEWKIPPYGPDPIGPHWRAASYVDRILKGEKAADLPVQAPVKYEMVLNLKAAKALRLDIPAQLRALANEVIE
jgi:putative ABC transport system substrate-binding protein